MRGKILRTNSVPAVLHVKTTLEDMLEAFLLRTQFKKREVSEIRKQDTSTGLDQLNLFFDTIN